jgi:hypothetical protein
MSESIYFVYGVRYTTSVATENVRKYDENTGALSEDSRECGTDVHIGNRIVRFDIDADFDRFDTFEVFPDKTYKGESASGIIGDTNLNRLDVAAAFPGSISVLEGQTRVNTAAVDEYFAAFGVKPEWFIRYF